jgi:hypothetical protein
VAIDYTTDLGKVRLLISDVDETSPTLQDAQITAFLTMEGDVKLAAAAALDTIARSEALVSKVIRTQDLQTDGPRLAAELRASASELRRQVFAGDTDDDGGITIVDFDPYRAFTAELENPGEC